LDEFWADFQRLRAEISKVIVGQQEILDDMLISLIAGGHVLLEGVPGLGKTLTVRTLADALHLDFHRIQFTPDLMPADLIGTNVVHETADGGHVGSGTEFGRCGHGGLPGCARAANGGTGV
jgi:MoxR-like ATPase